MNHLRPREAKLYLLGHTVSQSSSKDDPEPRDSQRGAPTLTVTLASLSFVPFGLFIYHISAPSSLAPCCSPAYAHTHTHTLWAT